MATYRVFFIDDDGHMSELPQLFECENDTDAAQKAKRYINGKDIEVWRGGVFIARFPHIDHTATAQK